MIWILRLFVSVLLLRLKVCSGLRIVYLNASQSLTESSWDLWLDGYSQAIPDRKVSVYHKGAIAAQILDLFIQKNTKNECSLDNVMRLMWERFGKKNTGVPQGYLLEDYKNICEEVAGYSLDWYFEKCIFGNESLFDLLNENTNVNRTVTAYSITDTRTNRLQRYFMLSFIFRFSKFDGSKAGAAMPMRQGGGMRMMGGPGF